jgi:hypothetical protein
MLHGYIGDEAFRSGMKDYLTKYSYKNTETQDLWACLVPMLSYFSLASLMAILNKPEFLSQSSFSGWSNICEEGEEPTYREGTDIYKKYIYVGILCFDSDALIDCFNLFFILWLD